MRCLPLQKSSFFLAFFLPLKQANFWIPLECASFIFVLALWPDAMSVKIFFWEFGANSDSNYSAVDSAAWSIDNAELVREVARGPLFSCQFWLVTPFQHSLDSSSIETGCCWKKRSVLEAGERERERERERQQLDRQTPGDSRDSTLTKCVASVLPVWLFLLSYLVANVYEQGSCLE